MSKKQKKQIHAHNQTKQTYKQKINNKKRTN